IPAAGLDGGRARPASVAGSSRGPPPTRCAGGAGRGRDRVTVHLVALPARARGGRPRGRGARRGRRPPHAQRGARAARGPARCAGRRGGVVVTAEPITGGAFATDSATDPVARVRQRLPVRLLGVWAHPDDEAYLSAGLMARVAHTGGRVTCVTATRGELGRPDDDPRPRSVFERLREDELRASLRIARVDRLRILGHPDGGCADLPHERGVAEIA